MASFVERISVIIDTKADQAVTGIKSFRTAVAEADGIGGKFKAGWKQTTSAVSQNIGAFAATAGAALFAFGVKALAAFEDTAKAAIDLGKATGLSTEQASRWIAVADDYQVSASDLAGVLGKMGKSLDTPAFERYGVATKNAAGETRSANAIFLDVLETLSNTAPADRAKVGADLLGRGWAAVAPILGKTREEYEKMLAEVEAGQVITASEAKKAERMRLAQDKLADALGDVTLAVGEQVAALAPYIEKLADIVALTAKINPEVGSMGDQIRSLAEAAENSGDAIAYLVEKGWSVEKAEGIMAGYRAELEALPPTLEDAKEANDKLAEAAKRVRTALMNASGQTREAKEAMEGMATATAEADREFDQLLGTIDNEQAWLDLLDTLDAYNATMTDSAATDREKTRASLSLKEALIQQLQAIDGLDKDVTSDVLTLIDQGSYDEAAWIIGELTKARDLIINPKLGKGAAGSFVIKPGSQYAHGTKSAAPGMALVGEQGPELVMMGGGERVFTASETARMTSGGSGGGTYNITVNAPSVDAEAVVRVLQEHIRRNGGVL